MVGYSSDPHILAIPRAVGMNRSVQMVADGIPAFSTWIPSCTLHALQDPQSPMAMTTASQDAANSLIAAGSAALDALGLRCHCTSAIS